MASDVHTLAESCGCDNCMKLQCLFQNVTGLESLIEQLKLAFSEDLPPIIQREINAFLNSNWNWEDDSIDCKDEIKIAIKDEYPDEEINEKWDEIENDEEDKLTIQPKIAIKSAEALFEPDEEESEEIDQGEIVTAVCASSSSGIRDLTKKRVLSQINMSDAKNKKWIQCTVCELSFKTTEQLNCHLESHEITHECSECHMGFYSLNEASNHTCFLVNGDSTETEEEQSPVGTTQPIEEIVLDEDSEDKGKEGDLLQCQHCDTYFISRDELEEHEENSHHLGTLRDAYNGVLYRIPSENSYCCGLCGKTCKNVSSFNTHMRSRHKTNPLKPPDNTCDICGKAYDTLTRLRRHMSYQHGSRDPDNAVEKPGHNCDVCGKTFPSSYRLKHHYRTHTGEKPCECEFCGKCFRNTSHLNDHRRIHTGERPYKCLHCGNSYIQGSQLKAHLRSRHGLSV